MRSKRRYTIEFAAEILGVDLDLLEEVAMTMTESDGVFYVSNGTDRSTIVFTEFALDDAKAQLNDPPIRAEFERLTALNR